MEGVIAVLGFWIFVIAIVMKKPLMVYLEKSKSAPPQELGVLDQRVQQLESLVSTLNNQLTEVNANTEYAQKLLVMSAQKLADAEQLLIETSNQTSILIQDAQQAQRNAPKMIEANVPSENFGKILNDHTVRFERLMPGSAAEVWKYLTTPEHLNQWLAEANIEAKIGGRVELNFDIGEMPERKEKGSRIIGLINGFDPQRKLAFSWMDTSNDLDSAVSIELEEKDGQTAVTLTHSRLPKSRMHEFLAGWHAHLDVLAARLSNIVPPDFSRRFNQVVGKYAAMVAATIVVSSAGAASMSMPAQAATGVDDNTYQSIKVERSGLMKRYDLLWRDVDEHQRRMDQLKRDGSLEAQRQVDQLDRQLEDEYRDLHQLESEIKNLDKVLN